VLLLDEPLGALDLKFRKDMQLELKRMQKQLGITFVYVTHDQEEALSMSDTIAVMDEGMIQQIDTPVGIYNEPVNSFVADFIGESNILYGKMRRDYLVAFSGREFECVDRGYNEDENIVVVIRPEDIKLVNPSESTINGVVTSLVFMGVHYEIRIQGEDGHEWLVQSTDPAEVGSRVGITLDPDDIHIMDRSQYDAADA
jgi:spermidine/putrescine transport system ATP-binding protein